MTGLQALKAEKAELESRLKKINAAIRLLSPGTRVLTPEGTLEEVMGYLLSQDLVDIL